MLADYCPYNQELAYKNSNRDSRCYLSDNQPPRKDDFYWIIFKDFSSENENYVLERYSSHSKCFDHGSVWEQYIDQCRRKRRVSPQVAGCYQVFIYSIKFSIVCFLIF